MPFVSVGVPNGLGGISVLQKYVTPWCVNCGKVRTSHESGICDVCARSHAEEAMHDEEITREDAEMLHRIARNVSPDDLPGYGVPVDALAKKLDRLLERRR